METAPALEFLPRSDREEAPLLLLSGIRDASRGGARFFSEERGRTSSVSLAEELMVNLKCTSLVINELRNRPCISESSHRRIPGSGGADGLPGSGAE